MTALLAIGYARAYYQDYKIKQEIRELKNEISQLERKKIESLEILDYVMSPAFVEEKARTELHMKKPGEKVAIIEGQGMVKQGEKTDNSGDRQMISNPLKWWYYFLHKPNPGA